MFLKGLRTFLFGLELTLLLVGVSNCGRQSTSTATNANQTPDQVQIAIHLLNPSHRGEPVVTLTTRSLVQQLYTTVLALAPLPQDVVCTAEMGPSYTLTFQEKGKTLTTATAEHYGCENVSFTGEKQQRQANSTFWSQLDQAIFQATPIARPKQLALLHTVPSTQSSQITSAAIAQRLYDAILTLPQAPQNENCTPELLHQYRLVFHTTEQAIPSIIDEKCNTISLAGNYLSRSGTFMMNNQFQQVFQQTLAKATFAPAQPDQLTLNSEPEQGIAQLSTITNARLRQQLYTHILLLPTGKTQPNCPSNEDKITGKGKWYILSFTQWDLPILAPVDAYEGSCTFVSLDQGQGMSTGQLLQGDTTFWNLVHQAAHV